MSRLESKRTFAKMYVMRSDTIYKLNNSILEANVNKKYKRIFLFREAPSPYTGLFPLGGCFYRKLYINNNKIPDNFIVNKVIDTLWKPSIYSILAQLTDTEYLYVGLNVAYTFRSTETICKSYQTINNIVLFYSAKK